MKTEDAVEVGAADVPEPASPGEGFVIEEVEMKGFMRYLEKTEPPIRFPEKFTAITGKTGAGKTSILDAITFALYKSTTRTDILGIKISDVCRPGGHVRVAFLQGDARYDVKRGFTTNGQSYLEVGRNGEPLGGSIPELEAAVRDVVGLDYLGFRNSTFVRQEEMKELGSESGSSRLEIFQKLFRLETFARAQDLAKHRFEELDKEVAGRTEEIRVRSENVKRLPTLREQFEAMQKDLAVRAEQARKLEADVASVERERDRLAKRHEAYVRAESELDAVHRRIKELDTNTAAAQQDVEAAARIEEAIRTLEADVRAREGVLEEADRLKERQVQYERVVRAREERAERRRAANEEHARRLRGLKERLFQVESRVRDLGSVLTKEEAFDTLRGEGALEERLRRIEREVTWLADRADLVKQLEDERDASAAELEGVRTRTATIGEGSFALSELKRQIEEVKEDIRREDEDHRRKVVALETEIARYEGEAVAVGFSQDDRRRLDEIREVRATLKAARETLDTRKAELRRVGDAEVRLRDLAALRTAAEAERASKEVVLADVRGSEEAYRAALETLRRLRPGLEEVRKEMYTREGRVAELRTQIETLKEEEARLDEAEAKLEALVRDRETLAILKGEVFHKRGIVMFAVEQLLPALQIETSRNLSDLTDGRLSRVKLETYEENRSHGIRILVEGVDTAWHDVAEFSGGERTQINAALRFAIARELASMPQVGRTYGRMRTLFIDEGDLGSLDTEGSRDLFVQKLKAMGKFFDKVILITHLEEVAEGFPGRVRVSMTPSKESRVELLS